MRYCPISMEDHVALEIVPGHDLRDMAVRFLDGSKANVIFQLDICPGDRALVLSDKIDGTGATPVSLPWVSNIHAPFVAVLYFSNDSVDIRLNGTSVGAYKLQPSISQCDIYFVDFPTEIRMAARGLDPALAARLIRAHDIAGAHWLYAFDADAYGAANPDVAEKCQTDNERLTHFVNYGLTEQRPIAPDKKVDTAFYRAFYPDLADLTDAELTRHFISFGYLEGRVASEAAFFARLGLADLTALPKAFMADAYLAANPESEPELASPWHGFAHLVRHGAEEGRDLAFSYTAGAIEALLQVATACKAFHKGAAVKFCLEALKREPTHGAALDLLADLRARPGDAADRARLISAKFGAKPVAVDKALALSRAHLETGNPQAAHEALELVDHNSLAGLEASALGLEIRSLFLAQNEQKARVLAAEEGVGAAVSFMRATYESPTGLAILPVPQTGGRAVQRLLWVYDGKASTSSMFRRLQKISEIKAAGLMVSAIDHRDQDLLFSALARCDAVLFDNLSLTAVIEFLVYAAVAAGLSTLSYRSSNAFHVSDYPGTEGDNAASISPTGPADLEDVLTMLAAERLELLVDRHIVSDTALGKVLGQAKEGADIFVYPPGFDPLNASLVEAYPPDLQRRRRRGHSKTRLIFSSTARHHDPAFDRLVVPTLQAALESDCDVELVLVGNLVIPGPLQPYKAQIRRFPMPKSRDVYTALLADADINLIPRIEGQADETTAMDDWLDASAVAIPSVISATSSVTAHLPGGDACMLAQNSADWRRSINALLEDGDKRRTLGASAQSIANQRFGTATMAVTAGRLVASLGAGAHSTSADDIAIMVDDDQQAALVTALLPRLIGMTGVTWQVRDYRRRDLTGVPRRHLQTNSINWVFCDDEPLDRRVNYRSDWLWCLSGFSTGTTALAASLIDRNQPIALLLDPELDVRGLWVLDAIDRVTSSAENPEQDIESRAIARRALVRAETIFVPEKKQLSVLSRLDIRTAKLLPNP